MNDEKLILYFYKDGLSDAKRRAIAAQLDADATLRQRYQALCEELGNIPRTAARAPDADKVARWHNSIERAAALERGRARPATGWFHLPSFAWGTALAAVLVAGIAIGVYIGGKNDVAVNPDPSNMIVDVTPQSDGTGAFTRGLQVHFRESRQNIDLLSDAPGVERQLLIMHIVQQNRLFAREAKQNNTPELARVLRAFEPILVRLAASDISESEARQLEAKLAFELNVMLTKLENTSSKEADDTFEPI